MKEGKDIKVKLEYEDSNDLYEHDAFRASVSPTEMIEFYEYLLAAGRIEENGAAHTRLKYLKTRHKLWEQWK